MKKQLKGKQSFYDDKQRENVVSYYLMEDQEHTMYGVELEKYQEERIRAFLSASGDGFYMTSMLRTLSKNILLIGNSGNDVLGRLPEFNRDYVFAYILNSYGSIAGILVAAVLAALVMFIFGASVKQKNELGMVMGLGCGMIFLLNVLVNLLGSLGLIPPVSSFLPFLSIGRSNILLCYALVGIIMSIYRYKDCLLYTSPSPRD